MDALTASVLTFNCSCNCNCNWNIQKSDYSNVFSWLLLLFLLYVKEVYHNGMPCICVRDLACSLPDVNVYCAFVVLFVV